MFGTEPYFISILRVFFKHSLNGGSTMSCRLILASTVTIKRLKRSNRTTIALEVPNRQVVERSHSIHRHRTSVIKR